MVGPVWQSKFDAIQDPVFTFYSANKLSDEQIRSIVNTVHHQGALQKENKQVEDRFAELTTAKISRSPESEDGAKEICVQLDDIGRKHNSAMHLTASRVIRWLLREVNEKDSKIRQAKSALSENIGFN